MNKTIPLLATMLTLFGNAELSAQGVIVDQGQFSIRVGGQVIGAEDFVIRRAGLGRQDAVFANGVVSVTTNGQIQEVRPLLRATPPEGTAESYQAVVTGPQAIEVRLARSGRRYIATINSELGDEDREFQARPDTRVLEMGVAHHYYFLRDLREGREAHTLEPRTSRQVMLIAGARTEVELRLGPNRVPALRVDFASDRDDDRVVWFDRQGRVLRVEIPSLRYVAERIDLVG
jgi:hypothetical protein